MGGTSGGPTALPTPPASAASSASSPADDGGFYGDAIGLDDASAGLPEALPPSFLTEGVGLGQTNLPGDVFRSSSLMAENGLLDAPTLYREPGVHRRPESSPGHARRQA